MLMTPRPGESVTREERRTVPDEAVGGDRAEARQPNHKMPTRCAEVVNIRVREHVDEARC